MQQDRTEPQREQQERAIAELEGVLRLQPEDGATRAQLAMLLRNAGELRRAEAEARRAVQAAPAIAYTHHVLGLVFATLGAHELSAQALTNAARLEPGDGSIWNNLGRTYASLGHKSTAVEAFRKAVQCSPENALFHANLAGACVENSQHDESVRHFQKALELSPGNADTWNNLGQVLDELGRATEAERCLRRALACNPQHAQAYVNLLIHHAAGVTETDRAACNALLESRKLGDKDESNLLLALAQTEDRRGAFREAAALLERANRAKSRWHRAGADAYQPAEYERLVNVVIETFTADFLRARAGWGVATDVPVFVFGLPRSGTTLTEQFLAAHPRVHGAGELQLASASFALALGSGAGKAETGGILGQLSAADIESIAQQYLAELRRLSPGAARIVDKMPENYLYAGWLALLFPKARFICCLRDFRDVALSAMITSFRHVQWSSDREHLLHRFVQFRRLYDHWRTVLEGRMLTVHYHETIDAPEDTARRLVDWAGLPWDPACLDHRNSDARIRTASLSQARQPIYRSSIGRWRNYAPFMPELFAELASIDPVRHEDP